MPELTRGWTDPPFPCSTNPSTIPEFRIEGGGEDVVALAGRIARADPGASPATILGGAGEASLGTGSQAETVEERKREDRLFSLSFRGFRLMG